MTKAKPGGVQGRPKGSGAGLGRTLSTRLPLDSTERIEAEAKRRGVELAELMREILDRWVKRNTEGTR